MHKHSTVDVYDNLNLGAHVVMTWPYDAMEPDHSLVQDSLVNNKEINVDAGTVHTVTRSSD